MNYIIATILGIILGQVSGHLIRFLPPILEDEDAHKKLIKALKQKFKIDYIYTIILVIVFNVITYFLTSNIYLYMALTFALLVVFVIDYKYQLISDLTQIVIFLLGIIFTILDSTNILSHILGLVLGAGAFFLIGLLGKLIYKKEGMGFGDVKLMGGLGLIFGFKETIVITILSFFIAAIVSIILIMFKTKKLTSYIPFGPFIAISVLLVMLLGKDIFVNTYISFCTKLGTVITDVLFKIMY